MAWEKVGEIWADTGSSSSGGGGGGCCECVGCICCCCFVICTLSAVIMPFYVAFGLDYLGVCTAYYVIWLLVSSILLIALFCWAISIVACLILAIFADAGKKPLVIILGLFSCIFIVLFIGIAGWVISGTVLYTNENQENLNNTPPCSNPFEIIFMSYANLRNALELFVLFLIIINEV